MTTSSGLTLWATAETAGWAGHSVLFPVRSPALNTAELGLLSGTLFPIPSLPSLALYYLRAKLLHSSSDSPNTLKGYTELD